MPSDSVRNLRRMLREQESDGAQDNSGSETLYHGVSSTQRGGSAFDKVLSMIDLGYLFPLGKKNFTALDLTKMAVVAHSDARGIRDTEPVSVDEYIERCGDTELLEQPGVKEYLSDSDMRLAANKFKHNRVGLGSTNRDYTNFLSVDETDTRETYGDEFYFEFSIPKDDVYKSFDGAVDARTHKPIDLENARRLVVGSQYAVKASGLRKRLGNKGFGHVSVEVGNEGK
jgi:hypothetical protein